MCVGTAPKQILGAQHLGGTTKYWYARHLDRYGQAGGQWSVVRPAGEPRESSCQLALRLDGRGVSPERGWQLPAVRLPAAAVLVCLECLDLECLESRTPSIGQGGCQLT